MKLLPELGYTKHSLQEWADFTGMYICFSKINKGIMTIMTDVKPIYQEDVNDMSCIESRSASIPSSCVTDADYVHYSIKESLHIPKTVGNYPL